MKCWVVCLLIGALMLVMPVLSAPVVEISPKSNEILYAGMPVTIDYSGLEDGYEFFTTIEQWRIPDDVCPRNLTVNYLNPFPIDGGIISGETVEESEVLWIDGFISRIYHEQMDSGVYGIDLGEYNCESEMYENITLGVTGEKLSGSDSGQFVLLPYQINPLKGYLRITIDIFDGSDYYQSVEIVPYDMTVYPPVVMVEDQDVTVGEQQTGNVTLSQVSSGLSGYNLTLNLSESGSIGKYTAVSFPVGVITDTPIVTDSLIRFNATADISGSLDDFTLCTITYEGVSPGEAFSNVTVRALKNETGASIMPAYTLNGTLTVVAPPLPPSDFSGTPTSGIIPFDVSFTNSTQTGQVVFNWSYDDNTPNDTTSNPVHTYWLSGDHDVTLTVLGESGENTTQKQEYIKARQVPIWFKSNLTEGESPLLVMFNGTTIGPKTDWLYQFGDGETGTDANMTHQYDAPGTYTVRASANLGGARSTAVRYQYIIVN